MEKEWPKRTSLKPGTKNVINESLIEPSKVFLPPPLHINLKKLFQKLKFAGLCNRVLHKSPKTIKFL